MTTPKFVPSLVPIQDFQRISFKDLSANVDKYLRFVDTYADHYIFKYKKKDLCLVPFNPKYVDVQLELPADLLEELDKLAKKNKISLNELIRRALKEYIENDSLKLQKSRKKRK